MEIVQFFRNFKERITRSINPAFSKYVIGVVTGVVRENFMQGGRPQRWEPNKDKSKPLIHSGRLMWAASHPSLVISGNRFTYIAEVGEGGVAHQYGVNKIVSVKGEKKVFRRHMLLPSRPYFMIPEDRMDHVTRKIEYSMSKDLNND